MFIVTAGLSYRAVENKYLKELLKFVWQNPANYQHPSRRSIKNFFKGEVVQEKKEVKMGFIAVTVHFIIKGLILNSINLGV